MSLPPFASLEPPYGWRRRQERHRSATCLPTDLQTWRASWGTRPGTTRKSACTGRCRPTLRRQRSGYSMSVCQVLHELLILSNLSITRCYHIHFSYLKKKKKTPEVSKKQIDCPKMRGELVRKMLS